MWQMIKGELRYNWLRFAVFLAAAPLVFLAELRYPEAGASFLGFLLLLMMINTWTAVGIREKRDFQFIQLPVAAREVALARLVILLLASAGFVCWYVVLHLIVQGSALAGPRIVLSLLAFVIAVFSLAFIFRDRFVGTQNLMRGKMILVVLLLATTLLGVYTLLLSNRARDAGAGPPALFRFFDFLERHNPTTSNLNTIIFVAVSLGLAALTVETFARRRSQM